MSPYLTDFDRDTLEVAIKLARDHDPTLTVDDAEPVFTADVPGVVLAATGQSPSSSRIKLLRLFGRLPQDRGRVAGEPFWMKRDIVRWASKRPGAS
jgi:hypothetical protein